MKKIISSVLLFTVISVFASGEVKHLKILTIGNSFSNSVFSVLQNIVKQDPQCALTIAKASMGGATFSGHWSNHLKSEKNPSFKPYQKKYSLREALIRENGISLPYSREAAKAGWLHPFIRLPII